ncbi:hypothetical protein FACS189428_1110 [Clostridia bacterium]|nr:hypothetical protein FACS189428_1110 [Clostridia bacterium]
MFFLMLMLMVMSTASMNAQVTIGSDKNPHAGAVLDLQSDNLGLKLPNVALDNDLTVFKLPVTETATAADAKGMYVYNTNPDVGEGVYVWDGYQWLLVKASPGEKPVTAIGIISESGSFSVELLKSLKLNAIVTPSDASNNEIVWSIDEGTGSLIGGVNGSFTGRIPGRVKVLARTTDGSIGASAYVIITKDTLSVSKQQIGTREYLTGEIAENLWQLENSMEGVSSYQTPGAANPAASGYYYNASQARNGACPSPWRLPTQSDYAKLIEVLQNNDAHGAWEYWNTGVSIGWYNSSATWVPNTSRWWTNSPSHDGWYYLVTLYGTNTIAFDDTVSNVSAVNVRCVHE